VRKIDQHEANSLASCFIFFTDSKKEKERMDFYMKLPRNKKEFAMMLAVISIISVNIIAPLITGFEVGFNLNIWADTLKVIPFIWIAVIALVLITHKPAEWLTARIIKEGGSFGTHMIINILCTVFLMSIFMTVIGSWIGMRHISMESVVCGHVMLQFHSL